MPRAAPMTKQVPVLAAFAHIDWAVSLDDLKGTVDPIGPFQLPQGHCHPPGAQAGTMPVPVHVAQGGAQDFHPVLKSDSGRSSLGNDGDSMPALHQYLGQAGNVGCDASSTHLAVKVNGRETDVQAILGKDCSGSGGHDTPLVGNVTPRTQICLGDWFTQPI